jgi:hypothetical protein
VRLRFSCGGFTCVHRGADKRAVPITHCPREASDSAPTYVHLNRWQFPCTTNCTVAASGLCKAGEADDTTTANPQTRLLDLLGRAG